MPPSLLGATGTFYRADIAGMTAAGQPQTTPIRVEVSFDDRRFVGTFDVAVERVDEAIARLGMRLLRKDEV